MRSANGDIITWVHIGGVFMRTNVCLLAARNTHIKWTWNQRHTIQKSHSTRADDAVRASVRELSQRHWQIHSKSPSQLNRDDAGVSGGRFFCQRSQNGFVCVIGTPRTVTCISFEPVNGSQSGEMHLYYFLLTNAHQYVRNTRVSSMNIPGEINGVCICTFGADQLALIDLSLKAVSFF